MTIPLVIAAETGAAAELVGIVQNPRDGSPDYSLSALAGTGELLADLGRRSLTPATLIHADTTIGHNATVGAGALVNSDVAAHTTVVGVPAKPLG